jgi:hypothetical protein
MKLLADRFSVFGKSYAILRSLTVFALVIAITLNGISLLISETPRAKADAIWSVGSQLSSIRANGNDLYILWQNNSPDQNIYFKKSGDHGNSFGNTIRLSTISNSDSGHGFASDPVMAVPDEPKKANGDIGVNDNDEKYVYVAWMNRETAASNSKVLFRSSSDSGNTFGEPIDLTDRNFKGDSEIQQLFASGTNVYAVIIKEWADENETSSYYYDLVLRVSKDNGNTFSDPIRLLPNLQTRNVRASLSVSFSSIILSNNSGLEDRLASNTEEKSGYKLSHDTIYVTWIDYGGCTVDQVTCEDVKIFFRKSTDSGKTFSNPVLIERPKEALDYDKSLRSPEPMYLQGTASADGQNVYVAWAEYILKEEEQRIFLAKSNDAGLTFSNPVDLSKNGISDSPRLIVPTFFDNDKNANTSGSDYDPLFVAWKQQGKYNTNNTSLLPASTPRIVLLKSIDGGNTYSQPVTVSPGMERPFWDMSTSQTGKQVYVAWENATQNLSGLPKGIDVYFKASNDSGDTFENSSDLSDDIGLKTLLAAQSKPLSFIAPQIATSSNSNYVYAAWQTSYPDSTEIYLKASEDGGQSFGRIVSLNDLTKDPISGSIAAAGSSNPFLGQILTPVGLTISGSIATVLAGVIAFLVLRKRK